MIHLETLLYWWNNAFKSCMQTFGVVFKIPLPPPSGSYNTFHTHAYTDFKLLDFRNIETKILVKFVILPHPLLINVNWSKGRVQKKESMTIWES